MQRHLYAAMLSLSFAAAGCSGSGSGSSTGPPPGPVPTPAPGGKQIEHVVIVVQENRSFDNLFATFPGADGATSGKTHDGKTVPLVKGNLASVDLNHMYDGYETEYDGGKMDGFDSIGFGAAGQGGPAGLYPYRYVDPAQIVPYWSMARQYVLADHMFQTQGSGSYTAHQDLIRGDTKISADASVIDSPSLPPWGCDAPRSKGGTAAAPAPTPFHTVTSLLTTDGQYLFNMGPFPCYTYSTLRDLLDAKRLSWKYYVPSLNIPASTGELWNAFDSIKAVRYSTEWKANVISPETTVLRDAAGGRLPAVSWVIPDASNSDHPYGTDTGPSWVASIVNAIGRGPDWNTTAIVVVWDDWGGFYDNAPPPIIDRSGGLGFRVPMLVVSPYAKTGYVSHTQYEFGSILRFIEDNWALGRLGTTDTRAASISDCFDFSHAPRSFKPFAAKYSRTFFEHQRPSNIPVDTQ